MRANGSYVGRAAPEIDIIEATVENGVGKVSLSAQWAPFNVRFLACPLKSILNRLQARYDWKNTPENFKIYDETTHLNGYKGGT